MDIRINDISVSRFHALLKLEKGEFFLEDSNSKFGTLALIRDPISLTENNSFALQIGRTVFSLSIKKKKKMKSTCFGFHNLKCLKICSTIFFFRITTKKELNDLPSNRGKANSVNEEIKKNEMEIEENNNQVEPEADEIEVGNNDANELDNVIFNNDAVPNHIDIIDFNDGDEENMEPEVIMGGENVNNNVMFIKSFNFSEIYFYLMRMSTKTDKIKIST